MLQMTKEGKTQSSQVYQLHFIVVRNEEANSFEGEKDSHRVRVLRYDISALHP